VVLQVRWVWGLLDDLVVFQVRLGKFTGLLGGIPRSLGGGFKGPNL
jgi:hypothetical protein